MAKITEKSLKDLCGQNKEIGEEHFKQITEEWKNNIEMKIYPLQEDILNNVWNDKENLKLDNPQYVKFLCKLVDRYYSTNLKEALYDTNSDNTTVIKKIIENKEFFDGLPKLTKLSENDVSTIVAISKDLYSKTAKEHKKTVLSFMSKFCSRFNQDIIPIYDKLVREMLVKINNIKEWEYTKIKISVNGKNQPLTGNYNLYKEALDAFNKKFFESKLTYKELDKYLWTWAKLITNEEDNSED